MKQLIKLGLLPHRQTCLLQSAQLAGTHQCMSWSKCVAARAQGLVINATVSTVLYRASAHPHTLYWPNAHQPPHFFHWWTTH